MTTRKPVSLKNLLDQTATTVGRLIERSAEVDTLTSAVKSLLPETLRKHLLVASQRDQVLCLVADSAVWAAKLRYHAPDILTSLSSKQGWSLQKIKVSVAGNASRLPG